MQPVCLVIGAGAGIGSHVGSRFAREGYHAVLCRRTDQEGLDRSVASIRGEGGAASGFLLNAVAPGAIQERIAAVEADIGPIEVVIYNLGAQIGDRPLADTSHKAFELGWRLATFGLFRTAASVCPLMEKRGRGTILVTSATAAMRGNKGQHSHAAAMAGAAHAVPDPQRGVRPQGHSRRAHRRRRYGRCARYARQNVGRESVPEAPGRAGIRAWTDCCFPPGSPIPTSTFPSSTDPRGHSSSISGRSATSHGGMANVALPGHPSASLGVLILRRQIGGLR